MILDGTAGVKGEGDTVAPAEVTLKVPTKAGAVGRLMDALVYAGYDISVESIYDDTFFEPKLLYYELKIGGSVNFLEGEDENVGSN